MVNQFAATDAAYSWSPAALRRARPHWLTGYR